MTHEAGFVQTLLESPTDDATRLIFADWLADQGDAALAARGELLRVQTELAAWVPDLKRRLELQERERQLLAEHRPAWLGDLAALADDARLVLGLADVTLRAERLLDHRHVIRSALLRAWVRGLRLTGPIDELAVDLADSPVLAEISALDLGRTGLTDLGLRGLLLTAPQRLLSLDLSGNDLTDASARFLAGQPWLKQLAVLDLRNNRISSVGVTHLLAALGEDVPRCDLQGNLLDAATRARLHARRQRLDPAFQGEPPDRLFNSVGMEFQLVPAGTFLMGSPESEEDRKTEQPDEGPVHGVTISRPFYAGVYPVTQREYQAVAGDNPSQFTAVANGGPEHPVEQVTWEGAREFCRRLSALPAERAAGRVYRLASEAEWEHLCRGGTTTPFWFGTSATSDEANFDGNHPYGGARRGAYLQRTTPVGWFRANPFGLYDTHGNVWEWCADWYDERYYSISPPVDPPGSGHDGRRSSRGGSWWDMGSRCRSAFRDYWYGAHYAASKIGLRVVLTLPANGITGGLPATAAPPPPMRRR